MGPWGPPSLVPRPPTYISNPQVTSRIWVRDLGSPPSGYAPEYTSLINTLHAD